MRVISPAAWRAQPWKNGGGITHELVRWPDRDDYDVRVSLAEVTTSGPFSRFPRYRRWSFLVSTAPIELAGRGAVTTSLVAPGDHVELPGDVALTATLPAGPTHLLNVLARDGACVAGYGPSAHPVRLVFALAPRPADATRPALARWSAVVWDAVVHTDTTDCVWLS